MKKYFLLIILFFLIFLQIEAQTVNWGPSIPAGTSEAISACYEEGELTIEFTNVGIPLVDVIVEIQLDTGIFYVPSSVTYTSTGSATVTENSISNLNKPLFNVGAVATGEEISITIERTADCEAMALKINGSTFIDTTRIYESRTEVTYANGIANGTVSYDIIYGSLSITSVDTDLGVINLQSSSTRSMEITNGSFGPIENFYFADVANAGDITLSDFRINPDGVNYAIPPGNISVAGDYVIVSFTSLEIAAIDGTGSTVGDGDGIFEKDEFFVLEYTVTPNTCGESNTIPSRLLGWIGCAGGERCEEVENAASLGIINSTPNIALSNASKPRLDFCDTVIYSVKLTNTTPETTPAGGAFAKDVTAFLGFRANTSPISTLSNVTQWGTGRHNTKHFTNHKLNGYPVTLPLIAGRFTTTLPYLPPDYFTVDPDGPGGLDDLDGDGYFDDLAKDSVVVISYGVYITPKDPSCDLGRTDYISWEHIAADISWYNQCGTLMSPRRQEFNYTNHIRDYLNSTFVDFPTDISDGENFTVGIKPHLYTTINCNGASGVNGAGVDWVTRIVLPPGLSMKSGFDPLVYTVSNDTVTTSSSYSYTWTNFPLEFDCDNWDGTNPVEFSISTFYICGDGTDICYEEEVHCSDISIVPHCPTSCAGVVPVNFTAERISESWTDETQTTLVDLDDPDIVTDFVFPFDTVAFFATGVFSDTMSDQLYLRITYSPESGGNIFSYDGGELEIIDIDGQYNSGTTNYTIPLTTAPTINDLGGDNYEMIFDLSSYRTFVDANYNYGQNSGGPPAYDADTIKLRANVIISNTMTVYAPWNVDNLRSEFFLYDDDDNEVICNSWGTSLSYEYPYSYAGNNERANSGCNSVEKYFYLTNQSFTADNHPDEYRPPYHIDSAVMKIPVGWDIGKVTWIDNTVMNPADYEFRADRTMVLRRPASFNDYDKRNTFYPKFRIEVTPNCQATEGRNYFDYTCYLKDFAYLTDESSHVPRTSTKNTGFINYTRPTMTVTPLNQTVIAYEDNVAWTIRVCNSTSDMDVAYNWLLLENEANQIQVDSVVDVTGGGSVLLSKTTTPDGGIYVEVGSLDHGDCADIIIYSSFTSCDRDTLQIGHGWSCSEYPIPADAVACDDGNEVYILPQSAQISSSVTPLASTPSDPSNPGAGTWGSSTIEMCKNFPAEITVLNAQPAYLYDVNLKIKIPSAGNSFTYLPGSATIELEGVDAINIPRSIGAAAEAALVAASTDGDLYWEVSLAELDPTNFGSGEPFSGTLNSGFNEFILRWEMTATCDLVSGDFFYVTIEGNDPCGSPASGSGEQVKGYPINLDGVSAPYFTFIKAGIDPDDAYEGCNDSKNILLELLLSSGSTGSTDTLSVILPDGLGYGGGYACASPGKCPTYIGSTIVNNEEILSFKYPSGVTGSINMSFDLATDSRGDCTSAAENIRFVSKTTIAGLSCGLGSCASTDVITGNEELSVTIEKPILDVDFTYLLANTKESPYTYTYQVELSNTGLDTEEDVIIEFYSLNASKNDITGSAVGKDTLSSILTNGSTVTLSGEFLSTLDPTEGLAVLIVPEYDNCYCTALENLVDKTVGLDEVPHDSIVDLDIFSWYVDLDDDDDGIPDVEERRACSGTWTNIAAWTMNLGGPEPTIVNADATIRNQKPGPGWDSWSIPGSALSLNSTSLPQNLTEAIAGDFYVEYTLLPGSGKAFEITYLAWGWNDYTNTPKHDFKVAIYGSTDNYSSSIVAGVSRPNDTDNYIWQDNSVSGPFLSDITDSITFRVYVYEPTEGIGGSAITSGNIFWDDFLIGGYHAPLDDCDGDGVPNIYDLDSDNDGILDGIEAGHGEPLTAGVLTGIMGTNGLDNALETLIDNGVLDYSINDSDGDGTYDAFETDSDADGCADAIEAAGNFKRIDLDGTFALLGAVDVNGIPIAALGGQATTTDVRDPFDKTECPCPQVIINRHITRRVFRE